jgi:hypothetical protein
MSDFVKWRSSVVVHLKAGCSERQAITNTREAAHCLLVHWPDCRGDAYHRTVRMCGLVLCGLVAPEVARIAFLEAAEESAIYAL